MQDTLMIHKLLYSKGYSPIEVAINTY